MGRSTRSSSSRLAWSGRFSLWKARRNLTDLALASAISLLPTSLEDLHLEDLPASALIHSAVSEVVQWLNTCFEQLMAEWSLSDAAWEHLASLLKLEYFLVHDTPSTKTSRSVPHGITFPALKHMGTTVDNPCQHRPFLFSLFKSSPLQRVPVVVGRGIRPADVTGRVTIATPEAGLQRSVHTLTFVGFDPSHLMFISHLGPLSSLKALSCNTQC
jgi:hypothetical protein